MINILFICHGNICRSPMAEFILKDMVKKAGCEDEFYIDSAATSTEETGNPMYPPAKRKLREKGVPFTEHRARQITGGDFREFDYVIAMDRYNLRNLRSMFGADTAEMRKVSLLLDYAVIKGKAEKAEKEAMQADSDFYDGERRDIADPWYTGDFELTYNDIVRGCTAFLRFLGINPPSA